MEKIARLLAERRQEHLLRCLRPLRRRAAGRIVAEDGREYVDLSGNDYLGLSAHAALRRAAAQAGRQWGSGSSASRLLSGTTAAHQELETAVAAYKGTQAALLFNSGYQANVGIISALCEARDAVFVDRLAHASILDGCRLSGARLIRFAHNDMEHLRALLRKERGRARDCLIVSESVFSMDGDRCPLSALVALKQEFGCWLMIDEAHATGVFGPEGRGLVAAAGLSRQVDIIMGTFSKALGSFGAYCAATAATIEYLLNISRSFIYSTALPASIVAANRAALDVAATAAGRRARLAANSGVLRDLLRQSGYSVAGDTQIVPLLIGSAAAAVNSAETLHRKD